MVENFLKIISNVSCNPAKCKKIFVESEDEKPRFQRDREGGGRRRPYQRRFYKNRRRDRNSEAEDEEGGERKRGKEERPIRLGNTSKYTLKKY